MQAIFFDLDGTLADTAPGLAQALNRLLQEEGRGPLTLAQVRPQVTGGSRAMLSLGLGVTPDDAAYDALVQRFLTYYATHMNDGVGLFPGMPQLLDALDAQAIPWGIVTNKAARFTRPILQTLGLSRRCVCVISGDTTTTPKPHPAPLLLACEEARIRAADCLYVGDDERDIQAGRAAGMQTAAALWIYPGDKHETLAWGADHYLRSPADLLALIMSQVADRR